MTLKKVYQTKDIYPNFQSEHDSVESDVSTDLAKLKFFCGNANSKKNCCFSHLVGLPQHPATMQSMKFMPHQLDLIKQSMTDKQVKFHVNKSRQIGLTEIVMRIVQYHCFGKYKGGKILIIAGTREKTTKTVMNRLKMLFNLFIHTIQYKELTLAVLPKYF